MFTDDPNALPLPRNWPKIARTAILHAISLASTAISIARGWWLNSRISRVRQKAEIDRLREEIALLREEMRIKDRRMASIPPRNRPHYRPVERLAILELRAQRHWSAAQRARVFLVEPPTISSWMKRLEEEGRAALVQLREPVNRFPDFVRYLVRRLKALCPSMGKLRIAETLGRAGLHIAAKTVARMLKRDRPHLPEEQAVKARVTNSDEIPKRTVTASYPGHVLNVDLTTVPTMSGFWTMLSPFSLPPVWPFCWWIALVEDHFSRRIAGFALFFRQPTSLQVRTFLNKAFRLMGRIPKYVICDKGKQFWCGGFKAWCKRRGVRPRYGAVGKYGSLAVIERFMRSLKEECTRKIVVPLRLSSVREEIRLYIGWYNAHRPNQTLRGLTPDEVYFRHESANERPRYEPRRRYPRNAWCASPQAGVKGRRGVRLELEVSHMEGRRHLPLVELRPAA